MSLFDMYQVKAQEPIESIEAMRYHLANAAAVELSTVPLYLYAAYSIKTSGYPQWSPGVSAFRTIRSVVIEEMLHLCRARNMLIAIGGDMKLYGKKNVHSYPMDLPHRKPPLQLKLAAASTELVTKIFLELESPYPPKPKEVELYAAEFNPYEYGTLGEFYRAIETGFKFLAGEKHKDHPEELWGDAAEKKRRSALQYHRAYWNDDGGGAPLIVNDLNSALLAIKTIVDQGEGVLQEGKPPNDRVPKDFRTVPPTPGLDELTHYAKFQQIAKGIYGIGDVWPVITDPKLTDYKDDEAITALATLFDAAYCYVLCMLDRIYMTPSITPRDVEGEEGHDYIKGEPLKSKRYHLERTFLAAMGGLLYPIAELLVRQPLREGTSGVRTHAGPLFGYYDFKGNKKAKLIELCNAAVNHYPSLGGDDSVLQLCHLLPCVDDGGDVWKTAKHDLALA